MNIAMLELLKHTGRDKAVWIGTFDDLSFWASRQSHN